MELIDTHTHIYIKEFQDDYGDMMKRAREAGVSNFVLPSIDSEHTESMLSLESDDIHLMMGVHPCSIQPDTVRDLHWDISTKDLQIEAFEEKIGWAIDLDLPIVIHSRKSTEEVIEVLRANSDPKLRGIFHCFGGSVEEAEAIIDLGFLLGIGGVVTFKNAGLDKTIEVIDLEHLVLETDAPYLSPTPFRGKRNEPAYLKLVAEKVANVKGISIEAVSSTTTSNAKKVFRF